MYIGKVTDAQFIAPSVNENKVEQGSSFEEKLKQLQEAQTPEEEKTKEACRMLEAFFVQQILRQSGVFRLEEDSAATEMIADMAVEKLAEQISEAGGLGLAEALSQQLKK